MEENQKHDGTDSGNCDQSENQCDQDQREGAQNPNEGLRSIIIEIGDLTTFLQKEMTEAFKRESEENSEYVNEFKKLPDAQSIEIMEKNMNQVMMLVPMADAIGLNFVTSLIGSMAATVGFDPVTKAIEEINQKQFNDD
jgi:hypothetical protein